jgi:hypothetical protein
MGEKHMRTWTEAAKTAQREAIKRWKPWAKSTGPRTPEGKRRVALNSRKHGSVSVKARKVLRSALRAQRECCKIFAMMRTVSKLEKNEKQTIMLTNLCRLFQDFNAHFIWGLRAWNRLQKVEGGVLLPVPSALKL